ncbi:MAG: carbohydrate ABC transporter permease, partial [Alphaproteobacteria bacterium]|nr:carbohydrate ABC transporter permease [Alphaproteobacteria bacterium]
MFRPTLLGRLALHAANLLVILFLLFPLIAVVIGAVQSERTLQADTRAILPAEYTFDNFRVILTQGEQRGRVFEQATYLPDNIKSFYGAVLNSLIVALSVTLATLILGSLTAYTIARLRVRWTVWLMQLNVAARFVPIIVLMIPLYVMFRSSGLLNSLGAVILAQTGFLLPYAILILAPYFETIPGELEEAARIDGCSRLGAFLRIVLPLSTPGLSSCGAIIFIISWQDLLITMILNS